ncbi:MAG: hypothetical protein U0525_03865 [Patescibacteria group bacterium]
MFFRIELDYQEKFGDVGPVSIDCLDRLRCPLQTLSEVVSKSGIQNGFFVSGTLYRYNAHNSQNSLTGDVAYIRTSVFTPILTGDLETAEFVSRSRDVLKHTDLCSQCIWRR